MIKKFTTFLHKRLQDPQNKLNLRPALDLTMDLYDAVLHPRDWENPNGDWSATNSSDKFMHGGWSEYDSVCKAFEQAHRIETHIYPYLKGYALIEIKFYRSNARENFCCLQANQSTATGEIQMSGMSQSDEFVRSVYQGPAHAS